MRKPDVYKIPTLPASVLRGLQTIQEECRQALLSCGIPGTPYLDHDRATETIQAYAIEELDGRLNHYFGLSYCPREWAIEIVQRAVMSAMSCFPNFTFEVRGLSRPEGARYEDARQFFDELHTTALLHLMNRISTGSLPKLGALPLLKPADDRKELFNAYRSRFPETKIIEICWAARQHRREWDRWRKGELPDDCKADRCFRHVLKGDKRAVEMRKELRPKGWK